MNAMGEQATPYQSDDAFVQAVQTSAATVDLDMGVKRNQMAAAMEDRSRIIGGINLQNYDQRLNMRKGNIALIDTTKPARHRSAGGIGAYDGRPDVYSSMAGMTVPDGINNEWDWKRSQRPVGFLFFDTPIDNAGKGKAAHYGTTVITGGSMASVAHVVPEDIGAGELLVADIGPMDPDARAAWQADFRFNKMSHIAGSEKAVVRPFNPYAGIEYLGSAFTEFYAMINENAVSLDVAAAPARYGENVSQPDAVAAAGMAKPLFTAVWQGVALLANAGLISIKTGKAMVQDDTNLFDFNAQQKAANDLVAQRLGLNGTGSDRILMKAVFGAFWQPLTEHSELADALSMSGALTDGDLASRLQDEGAVQLVTTVTDVFYLNEAHIVGKNTHNSKQGNGGMRIVVTQ